MSCWGGGKFLYIAAALLLAAAAYLYYGFFRSSQYRSEEFLMDTLVSMTVYGKNPDTLKSGVSAAFAEFRRIAELSDNFPKSGSAACLASDICRINLHAGRSPVRVDPDIMAMLTLAKKQGMESRGLFDVTVGPLMDLWQFSGDNPEVPTPASISAALPLVGINRLELDEQKQTAFLPEKGMKLDLGAIAKGYATEKSANILQKSGIERALIDAGGNIRVIGKNQRGETWKIGVKHPRKQDSIAAVLQLTDTSAVTSGDYYRFFEANGKRYHHILDPRTGYPPTATQSVTVVTRDSALADVLSTVFFVLPPDDAIKMAAGMEGVGLFIVTADNRRLYTPSLNGIIEVTSDGSSGYDQRR